MYVAADLVLETTTTTGTGTLTLAGAVSNYLTFAAEVGEGNTCSYTIQASNGQLETGVGTVVGLTLERTTLISSSTGSKLVLPAGTHQVGGTANSASFTPTGLGDYAYKPGLSGGQTLIGGTGATDKLTLQGTSGNGTTGDGMSFKVGNNGALEALTVANSGTLTTKLSVGIATPNRQAKNSSGTIVLEERSDGNNLFLGVDAGKAITTGGGDTAFGTGAQVAVTEGNDNTAVGNWAQPNLTLGDYNTAMGSGAQVALVTGNANVAIGDYSQYYNVDGDNNIAIGHFAGVYHASGSTPQTNCENSIYIGTDARGKDNNDVNSIAIGYSARGLGANTAVFGNSSITLNRFFGSIGLNVDTPSAAFHLIKTTEQLRLGYDAANYAGFTVSNSGGLAIAAAGGVTVNGTSIWDAASIQGFGVTTTDPGDGDILVYRTASNAYVLEAKPTGSNPAAADVTFTPVGDLVATNVQAALAELDTDKSATGHTHSGVYEPAGVSAADITDSTTAGRALLTAVDASAQRTSLGLGSAATTASTDYATAAQGSLAASATQPGDDAADLGSGAATDNYVLTADGAGGAAWEVLPSWNGAISDINLDGGTDIGADLVDADLILVDDGATGTNRKSALSRVWTYITAKIAAGIAPLLTSYKETVYTITDGAAFEIDPANGSIQLITLGASRTPAATNFAAGHSITLMVNDGTAYTITWPSVTWVGGSAPTLATSGYTVINLWKVGSTLYGMSSGSVA